MTTYPSREGFLGSAFPLEGLYARPWEDWTGHVSPVFHSDFYLVLLTQETRERRDNETEDCFGGPHGEGIEQGGSVRVG